MIDLLDASGLRGAGYLVCAGAAVIVWWREHRAPADQQRALSLWPIYWMLTAGVLAVTGVAHLGSLGDRLAELGRSQARSAGWYESRRDLQAAVVITLAAIWLISVLVAIVWVPPRRRRYLPSAVAVATLLAFVAIRVVSLHQVDAVLYRRDVGGLRGVSIIELTLLALTLATILVRMRVRVVENWDEGERSAVVHG